MDRASFFVYSTIAFFLRRLPLVWVWWIGRLLGFAAYYIGAPYRRLALHNLQIAFGREMDAKELRKLARLHFATLGSNLFSSIKLPTLTREQLERCVRVEGLENMDEQIIAKGGFVMVISHLGNWEMFAQLSPFMFKCKVGTIYQALGNPHIDGEVRRDRARLGLELFERKAGFSGASKFIREGGAVGVLIDQHAGDAGIWCPFFGRLASTSTLAATLALRTDGWLIPAAVYSDGPGRWRCKLDPRIEPCGHDSSEITVRLNQVLEEQIREQPEDWFWVHNRWKMPRPKFLLSTYKRGLVSERLLVPSRAEFGPPGAVAGGLQRFPIVIRSSNWLGDAVMSIPAVRAIKRGRPDAYLAVLTPAKLADLWRTVSEVDEVIPIEPGDGVLRVASKLRGRFEVAIVFPNSLRTALEAKLAGIERRVGYPGHRRAWLLNQVYCEKKAKKARAPRHQVHHYLKLAEFVGADISSLAQSFAPASASPAQRPRLGLVPGAEYGPAKRWLPERFAEVMREAHRRYGAEWFIFGVEKDREIVEAILKDAGEVPCTNLVGRTTLPELVDRLRECDALVTNDTGTMHLAASLDRPLVAIFGSTEPSLTGPVDSRGKINPDRHIVLRHHVECSPCFLRECPIDFRCMKAVESSEVIDAVARLIERKAEGS